MRRRLAASMGAFREVYRNASIRRLELAAAGSTMGQYAFITGLAVYAFLEGGAKAVGAMAVIRSVPAAVAAPFVAVLADRYRRRRVMIASDLIRAALTASIVGIAYAGWSYWLVFVLAALVRVASMVFAPAEAALLPVLARTPEELTAANVSASTIDSVGIFIGPALAGLLLATTSAKGVFAMTMCAYLWSALMLARIAADVEPGGIREHVGLWSETTAGFRAIGAEPRLRLIVALYSAQTVIAGALNVLLVVAALDLLDLGKSGLGFLNSAAGVGGLVGALVVLAMATRSRMASSFGIGVALFGLPLAVIGLFPSPAVALLMLAAIGLGNTLTDVAAYTLLQRTASNEVLARVFGVLHSSQVATMGLGAVVAPLLISAFGIRTSLIAMGAFLPVLSGLLWAKLQGVDRASDVPERELSFLRGVPIFAPLPLGTVELLARRLEPLRLRAGDEIFRAGDHGDRFYVIADGEVDVLVGDEPKVEERGGWFGEIALLRDVPRTATVRARTDIELLALERDDFLAAVTGYAPSHEAAEAVVSERLGAPPTGILTT